MGYICTANRPCTGCEHFRYDDDYGNMSCFARYDELYDASKSINDTINLYSNQSEEANH